jgi:hypothetical protein
MPLKMASPCLIACNIHRMLTAVKLDDEAMLFATEVGEVWVDRMLAPELRVADLPIAQALPELLLGVGGVAAKRSCLVALVQSD